MSPSPPDEPPVRPSDVTSSAPTDDGDGVAPIGVETFVRQESGEWLVDIAVAFPDGVVRHSVNKYRTERHAQIAAQWIRRGASRDIEGPING